MKTTILATLAALATSLHAAEKGTLIFADDFNRSESQEEKDEPSNGWRTNSEKRANGHKQVDLRDGALHIFIHPEADHGVSVVHDAEFTDGTVELRFKLEAKGDSLGLNFADLKFKEVHAGHLFAARIHTDRVLLQDLKTGRMAKETHALNKAKKLSAAQKKALKAKEQVIKHQLKTSRWYQLRVDIDGDKLSVAIDGADIGSFQSAGISHPTKRTLRLAVPKNAVVDDLKIYKK